MSQPVLNEVIAEFDMSGRCVTCGKRIRRRRLVFRSNSIRDLIKQVADHNDKHPFYCKAHKPL